MCISVLLSHQASTLVCPRITNLCPQWVWIFISHLLCTPAGFLLPPLPSDQLLNILFPECPVKCHENLPFPADDDSWHCVLSGSLQGHFRESWGWSRGRKERGDVGKAFTVVSLKGQETWGLWSPYHCHKHLWEWVILTASVHGCKALEQHMVRSECHSAKCVVYQSSSVHQRREV